MTLKLKAEPSHVWEGGKDRILAVQCATAIRQIRMGRSARELVETIAATPAETTDGVLAKLRVFRHLYGGNHASLPRDVAPEAVLALSMVRDASRGRASP